jgi:hypothetical protein
VGGDKAEREYEGGSKMSAGKQKNRDPECPRGICQCRLGVAEGEEKEKEKKKKRRRDHREAERVRVILLTSIKLCISYTP